jgi:hypothetical protein
MPRAPFAIALILLASAAQAADLPAHTYDLFDGRSLDGFTVENGCEAEVRDGAILLKASNGWLRSHHTYADFRLEVECKALQAEAYDAGIYLRAAPEGAPFPKRAYQANLLQGQEGNIRTLPGAESTGLVRPGDWNTFLIEAVGEQIAMTINGKPAWRVQGATLPAGHVGLQVEVPKGGQFLVRKFRVTELGHRPLFNGTDLAHWEGADKPADLCWRIEDGLLHGTRSKGPWLRSREQFDDFNLRLEYRVEPGANSGVYVRVPADGNHHREDETKPPAGFEVQIVDDAAPKHANLKDYQYSASVYDIAGASPRVSRAPGEWNTLEINCEGHRVCHTHNGVRVVDAAPDSHPLIALRQLKGHLGLQNHGGGVAFRNIRIGPPLKQPAPPSTNSTSGAPAPDGAPRASSPPSESSPASTPARETPPESSPDPRR